MRMTNISDPFAKDSASIGMHILRYFHLPGSVGVFVTSLTVNENITNAERFPKCECYTCPWQGYQLHLHFSNTGPDIGTGT